MEAEIHGHRGDRGNFPENTIPAFLSAVRKGADAIELDIVVSKDQKIVVSHEAFMNSEFMLQPNGKSILKSEEKNFNLYKMDYNEIREFDAGSKTNEKFLQQKKIKTHKPLLTEVIETVEAFLKKENKKPITYNIELKSETEAYGIFQPNPKEFVALVFSILQQQKIQDRFILQSFDTNVLEEIHRTHPKTCISYLVEKGDIHANLKKLSFLPNIYCPHYKLIKNKRFVEEVHSKQMKLNTWTVNQPKAIKQLLDFGVDGIITDFPELAIEIKKQA